jgi:glucosamine 6-phosphate synthetase-like amidotransferase/phosphosugar isomerase protein
MPIQKSIWKRYKNQDNRGKSGFGYIAIEDGKVKEVKRFTTEKEVEEALREETSSEIMFHHRLPTSTPNIAELNHPITVKLKEFEKNYYVIHNGVIDNDDDLYAKHKDMGFEYETLMEINTITETRKNKEEVKTYQFNDSECLAYEVALLLEGKQNEIEAEGTIAFICIETNKHNKIEYIHYGKNSGNPLIVERDELTGLLFIKSEGAGTSLVSDVLYSMDYATGEVSEENFAIGKDRVTPSYNSANKHTGFNMYDDYDNDDSAYGYNYRNNLFQQTESRNIRDLVPVNDETIDEVESRYNDYIAELEDRHEELIEQEEDLRIELGTYKTFAEDLSLGDLERQGYEEEVVAVQEAIAVIKQDRQEAERELQELYVKEYIDY